MIKARVAPSPTGFLHVGTAQSALYNWLFARKNNGEFHLRIEDTDKARSEQQYEDSIISALEWLDIKWDGPVTHSTDNEARYAELLQKLLTEGKAFYCHHTQEELDAERKEQEAAKLPPRHVCEHKKTDLGKQPGGIVRLLVDETSDRLVSFDDQIRGRVEFKQALLGDFSIGRSATDALYHFAVVVDDIDMGITHVLRGEDHISNTPKHILIYEALGSPVPVFAHLPLMLGADRSKLSKRHGDTAVMNYKADYLPQAIVNFLGCLGYTFSKEILTKEEMVAEFDVTKVHKSGAVFDIKKLNWINAQYIKKLTPDEFRALSGLTVSVPAIKLITERLERLTETQEFSYLWLEPAYGPELLRWKTTELSIIKESLQKARGVMADWDYQDGAVARAKLDAAAEENRGLIYWPLRVALSGKEKSPDPVDIALALGKEQTLTRIDEAIAKI